MSDIIDNRNACPRCGVIVAPSVLRGSMCLQCVEDTLMQKALVRYFERSIPARIIVEVTGTEFKIVEIVRK